MFNNFSLSFVFFLDPIRKRFEHRLLNLNRRLCLSFPRCYFFRYLVACDFLGHFLNFGVGFGLTSNTTLLSWWLISAFRITIFRNDVASILVAIAYLSMVSDNSATPYLRLWADAHHYLSPPCVCLYPLCPERIHSDGKLVLLHVAVVEGKLYKANERLNHKQLL